MGGQSRWAVGVDFSRPVAEIPPSSTRRRGPQVRAGQRSLDGAGRASPVVRGPPRAPQSQGRTQRMARARVCARACVCARAGGLVRACVKITVCDQRMRRCACA